MKGVRGSVIDSGTDARNFAEEPKQSVKPRVKDAGYGPIAAAARPGGGADLQGGGR